MELYCGGVGGQRVPIVSPITLYTITNVRYGYIDQYMYVYNHEGLKIAGDFKFKGKTYSFKNIFKIRNIMDNKKHFVHRKF